MERVIFVILISIVAVSCEKAEKPVKPYDRGNSFTDEVNMGNNYEYQIYYSLDNRQIVKKNLKTDWDIALDCEDSSITLNTSRNMLATITKSSELADISDTAGYKLKMDYPSGSRDSLSIGLPQTGKVYIIWLGYGLNGEDLGYIKARFKWEIQSTLVCEWSGLKEQQTHSFTLKPASAFNRVFYSFVNDRYADIEPPKETYDLWFTHYLHFFLEPEVTPYIVAGALINPHAIRVARLKNTKFAILGINDTMPGFSVQQDIIGYDWKAFSLSDNAYRIVPDLNFIIQSQLGFYYKFRFTDFYDNSGQRGKPKFEFGKI